MEFIKKLLFIINTENMGEYAYKKLYIENNKYGNVMMNVYRSQTVIRIRARFSAVQ